LKPTTRNRIRCFRTAASPLLHTAADSLPSICESAVNQNNIPHLIALLIP
jgi:hypothetical protein